MFDPATHARHLADLETSVRSARDGGPLFDRGQFARLVSILAVVIIAGVVIAGVVA